MNTSATLPMMNIGNISTRLPLIQGGMGVSVSLSHLASAVSNEGALGVIAAVGASVFCTEPELPYKKRSYLGLRSVIAKTRTLTKNPIGVNIMCALSDYDELVKAAVDEHVEVIISGAGLPLHLPELTAGTQVNLIPIISSVRAASIICRTWQKKYNRLPDAMIVEGPMAGGHLGFSLEELANKPSLEQIVVDVLSYVNSVETAHNCRIPVIAAGGIFSGTDIAHFLKLGASGVQMGTRFVCTQECDASDAFKAAYLNCKKEDIIIIKSPVGLPLRVIRNSFAAQVQKGRTPFTCTYHCLKSCTPAKSPFCIAKALSFAAEGQIAEAIFTCGENAYRIEKIVSVHELVSELETDCLQAMKA